jgi:mannose-6-phosphate isomerase-like protein (cupin superfamily)
MQAFELEAVRAEQKKSGNRYLEYLRSPSLSVGLYALPAGSLDPQQPHSEDEVYYVIRGRGKIQVGAEDRDVRAGTTVFVGAHVEHHFHSIDEDLEILVFFAPPEGSQMPAV